MEINFQRHHAAMLLKYSGISFIAGAVNHGFFSGERSLWTAAVGMGLFVVGAVMEHRLTRDHDSDKNDGLFRALLIGALLSIGLGFFTGGLQHFPDSPSRSAWVVPLGCFISIVAFAFDPSFKWKKSSVVYSAILGTFVSLGSYGVWQWLEQNPQYLGAHAHGPQADEGSPVALTALKVDRTVNIRMDDTFRFTPNQLSVKEGETLRLVVTNAGKSPHELVLGSQVEIRNHAEIMKTAISHDDHSSGASITLAPGATGDLVIKFSQAGAFEMACLIPGHYEAGMKGTVKVAMVTSDQSKQKHDHSSHKH